IFASDKMLRKGDWASSTEAPCFKVSSKTGSPVVLLKSASTRVSSLVNFGAWRERQYKPPATAAATSTITASFQERACRGFGVGMWPIFSIGGANRRLKRAVPPGVET